MPDESKMQAEVKRVAAKLRANSKPHHKAGTSQAESKKGMADEERRILAFADRVALAGIAIGLFGAIAALSFPLAYPDLIPVHSWRVVLLISLCILAIAIGFLIYEIVREIGTGRDKRTRKRLLIGLLVGSVIFGIVTWCLWPQDEMDKRLPGFGGYAVLRLFDDPDFRRKYVFNVTSGDGAKVSFYISASDRFTLSVIDVRGEPFSLEIPVSSNKIPLHDVMALFCEVGIVDGTTILRISVNGHEVERRTLQFVIDLGDKKWKGTAIGGAPLRFLEFGVWDQTFSNEKIRALIENVRAGFGLLLK